jgi:peptidoglycan/LPS O-acetylase OafA/YrhL
MLETRLAQPPGAGTARAPSPYRPDVDGLRAVAVLPVLLFHAGLSVFSGGYVGVDIFFVISGFVITNKIMGDLALGRFSLSDFYVRRIRRIFPALVAMILLSFALAWVILLPHEMEDFSRSALYVVGYLSNFYFWKNSGYFEIAAQTRPLLHTWSLSVEEQFYIFIPVMLALSYRYLRRYIPYLFMLAGFASFTLSVLATSVAPTANFFLLPTRAWEFFMGALLVLAPLPPIRGRILREAVAALGAALILYAVFFYTEATAFPGRAALTPVLGAAILIYAGTGQQTVVTRILTWPPMIWTGLISYSLYLFHWPVVVFARFALLRDVEGWEIGGVIVASFVLAYLSWRFVEQPFRTSGPDRSWKPAFGAALLCTAGIAAIGVAGMTTDGFRSRFGDTRIETAAQRGESQWMFRRCFLDNQAPSEWSGKDCVRTAGAARNALLWGDSFAAHYVPGLIRNAALLDHNIVQYTFAGCPPILSYVSYARPQCRAFNANVFKVIKDYRIEAVVIGTRWDQLRQRGLGGLPETIKRLTEAGVKVYVIGQSPMFDFNADILAFRKAGLAADGSSSWRLAFPRDDNDAIRAEAGTATFIDPLDRFCEGDTCIYNDRGKLLFFDYGHFSDAGSDLAVRSYFPFYEGEARAVSSARTRSAPTPPTAPKEG